MDSLNNNTRLVYSTEHGRVSSVSTKSAVNPIKDGVVRVRLETKGRQGKGMTVIIGLPLDEAELNDLAKKLKQRFATGGSVKKWNIELQGDHREAVVQELQTIGYSVRSG